MLVKTQRHYPSDLTDAQWKSIRHLLPPAKSRGRPRSTNLRRLIDAIFFVSRTGVAWRYLPSDFPPWQTVYSYFRRWVRQGIWHHLYDVIVHRVRRAAGRQSNPTLVIVDSQAVKAARGEQRGYDGFKRIRGRKRQILVDTLGFLHAMKVHAANVSDTEAACALYDCCHRTLLRHLEAVYADLGYRGTFARETLRRLGFPPTIHNPDPEAFTERLFKTEVERRKRQRTRGRGSPAKKRWIVERTFAWLSNFRRLARDYERHIEMSEGMIYIAMTQIGLRRLAT